MKSHRIISLALVLGSTLLVAACDDKKADAPADGDKKEATDKANDMKADKAEEKADAPEEKVEDKPAKADEGEAEAEEGADEAADEGTE